METKDFVLGYGAGKSSAVSEKIVEEVDAWLDEHITNPDSPPLDRSLTSSSAAAPADMVGDINDEVGELRNTLNTKADVIYDTASGDIASFPDGADGLPVKDLTVGIEPVQDTSGGDPSPTHICPISGWTGCNVARTGKNLLPMTVDGIKEANASASYVWAGNVCTFNGCTYEILTDNVGNVTGIKVNGTSDATSVLWLGKINYIADTQLYLNAGCQTENIRVYFRVSGFGKDVYTDASINDYQGVNTSINLSASGELWGNIRLGSGQTVDNLVFKPYVFSSANPMTTFEPYTGTTIPISWQSEAGTVYGGTLDVTTGVLTVTDANIASYNGETLPGEWISDRDVYAAGTTPTTGAQVVYKLATPQTYQLTPQEVTTLLGQNNIWADCGPSTVEYPCDTKLYIERLTAPEEDDMIANQNIASGVYFMVGNNLYLSTASIAANEAIKPGTGAGYNCIAKSLADALNDINS